MNEILYFIIKNCSFLYEQYEFRFIDSAISKFSGYAAIILGSSDLNIRFSVERGQMISEFQSNYEKKDIYSWYSIDVVRQLITGEKECIALMDEKNTNFLKNNISNILEIFSKQNVKNTILKLKQLERIRSKTLGGNRRGGGE
jgi:hypothetical protein